ncbi:protein O-glucosyltransferase 2-like [Condylostylus longicornis]|uniref:protein O-glucosyltransferase 2-like n=1 Tax=Condylostylus longicornis TaxID=2530218 RepID=UPI00244DD4C3|nr:protein O-glucosyltransferase 2-like [Condylostylus longicornis]
MTNKSKILNNLIFFIILTILTNFPIIHCTTNFVDNAKTLVYGPGLKPDVITLPARYFFIHAVDKSGVKFSVPPSAKFLFILEGHSPYGKCRYHHEIIDRGDGSFIVRYKILDYCDNVELHIKYNGSHVADSPYLIKKTIYSEKCYCPKELSVWLHDNECRREENRITSDLQPFKKVNFSSIRESLLKKFNSPGSISLCHYVIRNQEIYRVCYGKYTGFKMFMDSMLLSMTRLMKLPDIEFYLNLGDYPLSKKGGKQRTSGPYPIFSWCGSSDTYDIVLPTYDITESSLESMGRVTLDMLSVQKSVYPWSEKENKAFWRGRDSRRERLNLIDLSRMYPDIINASITNFFFFREEEEKYGPKVAHISFFEFFKYKFQINIDGSVASYRLPYLLGGDGTVFKQESPFYEHFYLKLIPNKHFIPIKRDLSDLVSKIKWAKENDARAREIAKEGRKFAESNLLSSHIYCYHAILFEEWSKRLVNSVAILPEMEEVQQDFKCSCKENPFSMKDEL